MAKKKSKRPASQTRSTGSRPATTATTKPGNAKAAPVKTATRTTKASATAVVKPSPAEPGGPNRLARKEEARKQREALRRKQERKQFLRRAAWGLLIAAVVAAIVFFIVTSRGPKALNAEEKQLISQSAAAATAAGCSAVQTTEDYSPSSLDRAHIGSQIPTPPALSTYPTTPPASGPHNGTPQKAGTFQQPPDVYMTIHSLEHGAAIIWFDPSLAGSPELQRILDFFRTPREKETKVIVAPYNYPDQGTAGQLPQGKQMVLVAWHHIETCNSLSLPAAFKFVADYRAGGPSEGYKGNAPEPSTPI
jgi:hypothetical protein